jgi:myosin heavy chain 6/7
LRKSLEIQVRDLQVRLDEAEANALKGGARIIQKLEQKVTLTNYLFLKLSE